jgi:hypothetical protein
MSCVRDKHTDAAVTVDEKGVHVFGVQLFLAVPEGIPCQRLAPPIFVEMGVVFIELVEAAENLFDVANPSAQRRSIRYKHRP